MSARTATEYAVAVFPDYADDLEPPLIAYATNDDLAVATQTATRLAAAWLESDWSEADLEDAGLDEAPEVVGLSFAVSCPGYPDPY